MNADSDYVPSPAPPWRNVAIPAADRVRILEDAAANGGAGDLAHGLALVFGEHEHPDWRRAAWEQVHPDPAERPDYWAWVASQDGVLLREIDVFVFAAPDSPDDEGNLVRLAGGMALVSWALSEAEQAAAIRAAVLQREEVRALGVDSDRLYVEAWDRRMDHEYELTEMVRAASLAEPPLPCEITELHLTAVARGALQQAGRAQQGPAP